MRSIHIQLFDFSELDSTVKEKALEDNRYINVDNDYWYEPMYEHFCDLCKSLGITVVFKTIYFRGFWSQGDGSAFEGAINVTELIHALQSNAWKTELPDIKLAFSRCPCDKRLIALIEKERIEATANISQKSHRHYAVSVDIEFNYNYGSCKEYKHIDGELDALEQWLSGIAHTLNTYLYKGLQDDYEALIMDDAVKESIESNAYSFTKNGETAMHLETLAE